MASTDPSQSSDDGRSNRRFVDRLGAAAVEAEMQTGRREETVEEAERNVVLRLLRAVAGFFVIGVGIAALALPGPGWLLIILGLSLLPFAWAERTILLIRRKIPGIPDEGSLPLSTWLIMGALLVTFTTLSIIFGDDISRWVAGLWGDPDRIFG